MTYIKPQFVHILFGGRIVENGGPELVQKLEKEGYDWIREKYPEAARDEDAMEESAKFQQPKRCAGLSSPAMTRPSPHRPAITPNLLLNQRILTNGN